MQKHEFKWLTLVYDHCVKIYIINQSKTTLRIIFKSITKIKNLNIHVNLLLDDNIKIFYTNTIKCQMCVCACVRARVWVGIHTNISGYACNSSILISGNRVDTGVPTATSLHILISVFQLEEFYSLLALLHLFWEDQKAYCNMKWQQLTVTKAMNVLIFHWLLIQTTFHIRQWLLGHWRLQ